MRTYFRAAAATIRRGLRKIPRPPLRRTARFAFPFQSAHYKWCVTRLPTVERRLATPGVSPAGREYGGKLRDYLSRHGRIRLEDVALRGSADRPDGDWRATMRVRRQGAPRPAARAAGPQVFVAIRAAGERTEALAHALAAAEVGPDRVTLLHEVPFATAIRAGFERGVASGAAWTLCLDADVLLRPGAVADLLTQARHLDPGMFGVSGVVADPLMGRQRVAGQHLYRTDLLRTALSTASFDPSQRRPESHVKRQMLAAGHAWHRSDVVMGLHDAEQFYADIFRKVVVHTRKHEKAMPIARRIWARTAATEPDARVAFWSMEAPERIGPVPPPKGAGARAVSIDRRQFPDRIDGFLGLVGLTEKPPLSADAMRPADVSARLAAFVEAEEWRGDPDGDTMATACAAAAPETAPPRLISCIGVDGPCGGDLPLLPHFLAHYAALGIPPSRMHLILNAQSEGHEGLAAARTLLDRAGTAAPQLWIGPYTSAGMWDRRRALQDSVAEADDWIVNADADEFHDYPATLREVIAFCDARGVRCVQGPFVDRIAADGSLPAIHPDRGLWEQVPVAAEVGLALGKRAGEEDAAGTVKMMLHRGDVRPGLGGHNPQEGPPEALIYGLPLMHFPRVKSPAWRRTLPFRVMHVKWTAGLVRRLEDRRGTEGASPAGSRYGGRILDYLQSTGGRIRPKDVHAHPPEAARMAWQNRVAEIAGHGMALARVRPRAAFLRQARNAAAAALDPDWTLRQLTFGSGGGLFHAHSYYDIPVLSDDARRIAAYRMRMQGRWMTPKDAVEIGIVDVETGGFARIGTSRAWSWQQGPMAQWLPGGQALIWNDRVRADDAADGDAFVARLHDIRTGTTRTLPRTVYAITPGGDAALSLNMARLDRARPGYGYPGGRGAALETGAPAEDGVWRMGLAADEPAPKLVLPLSRAVAFLAERLPQEERQEHLSGALVHWFNHVKLSPNGRRFTVKLRWRAADLQSPWTGRMGVSLTCGMDGTGLSLLARGASHVMWLDDRSLYFWHQSEGRFVMARDGIPHSADITAPYPELITRNVHFRHIPDAPDWAIYDTPYAEEIDVMRLHRGTGAATRLARFTGHRPHHGPFRCDLHPVPSRDGQRIVVTSLQDGGRQIYLLERKAAP